MFENKLITIILKNIVRYRYYTNIRYYDNNIELQLRLLYINEL